MKKRVLHLLLAVVLGISFIVPAFAWDNTPPENPRYTGCLFLTVQTSQLGEITVYLPVTYQSGYFSWDGSSLFNVTNSSITGYAYVGNNEFAVRWSAWSAAQYRNTNSGYNYNDLDITSIFSTNIQIAEDFPAVYSLVEDIIPLVLILLLGVILICLFMRRF